jgi:hypothetical protein
MILIYFAGEHMHNQSQSTSKHDQAQPPKRVDKLLDWRKKSRDVWKEKCLTAKLELKMKTLAVKRLHIGREDWKYRAKQAETKIQQIENERNGHLKEIEKLKKELISKNSEVEVLKKKL